MCESDVGMGTHKKRADTLSVGPTPRRAYWLPKSMLPANHIRKPRHWPLSTVEESTIGRNSCFSRRLQIWKSKKKRKWNLMISFPPFLWGGNACLHACANIGGEMDCCLLPVVGPSERTTVLSSLAVRGGIERETVFLQPDVLLSFRHRHKTHALSERVTHCWTRPTLSIPE